VKALAWPFVTHVHHQAAHFSAAPIVHRRQRRLSVLALDVSAPRVVDRKYELVELLGLGSMGEVWSARHLGLGQTCAVKLIGQETHEARDASLLRFSREARIAAGLSRKTRHIVSVTDFGRDEAGPYLVMELLDGQPLDACLEGGRTTEEASLIISQIAKGLGVAHREGILHRDLKPANVFVTRTEEGEPLVKLLDFGIARLLFEPLKPITVRGVVVGSPAYMSPEHVHGDPLDARADVWSLAVLAFEVLTGELPFAADTTAATLRRIAMFESTSIRSIRKDATPSLEAFFAHAFARRIEDRFQTAEELACAFAAALAPPPVIAPKRDRKRWLAIAALGSIAIGGGAVLVARPSSSNVPAHVAETPIHEAAPVTPAPPPAETKQLEAPQPPAPVQSKAKPALSKPAKPVVDPSSIF
jgi:serine/threonine-protein kinase